MTIDQYNNPVAIAEFMSQRRVDQMDVVANALATRSELLRTWMDPRRDINKECGYPETSTLTCEQYKQLFDREPIAERVVSVLPKECWQVTPRITDDEDAMEETAFEKAFKSLGKDLLGNSSYHREDTGSIIWDYLRRVDILSGIGHFGVLLLGIDDGKNLQEPVDGSTTPVTNDSYLTRGQEEQLRQLKNLTVNESKAIDQWAKERTLILNAAEQEPYTIKPNDFSYGGNPAGSLAGTDQQYFGVQLGPSELPSVRPARKGTKLLFLRPFDESLVQVVRYEWNINNPRFGMPVMYRITLNDPREAHSGVGLPIATVFVHWSRVIHVADNLNCSEIFGVPRMRPVLNRLLDLLKLYGGSAEMFWKGAFPGMAIETIPQLGGDVTIDAASLRSQMEQYQNGLQRYLALIGVSAKTLSPTVADPSNHIDKQIEAICIQLGIPKRVFLGSERGELASSQDDASWNDRLKARQNGYLTSRLITPFIDRLIAIGVLPEPVAPKDRARPKRMTKEPPQEQPNSNPEEGMFANNAIPAALDSDMEDEVEYPPETLEDTEEYDNSQEDALLPAEQRGYTVSWPDLDSNTELSKAQIASTKTQAMVAYVAGNVEAIMPLMDFYTRILGFEQDEAEAILAAAEEQVADEGLSRMTDDPTEIEREKFESDSDLKQQTIDEGMNPFEQKSFPFGQENDDSESPKQEAQ